MSDLQTVVDRIVKLRKTAPRRHAVLAAVSGIDGSGKGWVAARIVSGLESAGLHAANINIDGWLNLPQKGSATLRPPIIFTDMRYDLRRCLRNSSCR